MGVGLIAWRGDRLRSPGGIDSPVSREGAFLANNILFVGFTLIVLLEMCIRDRAPPDPSPPAVFLRHAVALSGRFPLLTGVDLTVARGETVLIEGPNGAGKTSLLRVCAGLVPLSSGRVAVFLSLIHI